MSEQIAELKEALTHTQNNLNEAIALLHETAREKDEALHFASLQIDTMAELYETIQTLIDEKNEALDERNEALNERNEAMYEKDEAISENAKLKRRFLH